MPIVGLKNRARKQAECENIRNFHLLTRVVLQCR
jgi:hypothetical protein